MLALLRTRALAATYTVSAKWLPELDITMRRNMEQSVRAVI